jgi:hypothetical protein
MGAGSRIVERVEYPFEEMLGLEVTPAAFLFSSTMTFVSDIIAKLDANDR